MGAVPLMPPYYGVYGPHLAAGMARAYRYGMTARQANELRTHINLLARELEAAIAQGASKAEIRAYKVRIRALEFQLSGE